MPERAEIEAVARELSLCVGWATDAHIDAVMDTYGSSAQRIIAVLDRLRDARGDDEAQWPESRKTHIRIPSVEGRMGFPPDVVKQYKAAARSPQGEDHEDNGSPPGEDHQKVELAFWDCGHIEVDVGVRHLCDDRDVCRATYVPYVRVSAPKADENQEAR